jgi:cysteinyl-tRNA synthetase
LTDDLNTPEAVAGLHRLAGQASAPERLKTSANLLGLLQQARSERQTIALSEAKIDASEINAIIAERARARATRNWIESDRLRDRLAALGVAIKDNKDGATSWELKR